MAETNIETNAVSGAYPAAFALTNNRSSGSTTSGSTTTTPSGSYTEPTNSSTNTGNSTGGTTTTPSGSYTEPTNPAVNTGGSTGTTSSGAYPEITPPASTGTATTTTVTQPKTKKLNLPYQGIFGIASELECAVMLLHYYKTGSITSTTFTENYLDTSSSADYDPNLYFGGDPYSDNGRCNAPVIIKAINRYLAKARYYYNAKQVSGSISSLCSNYIDFGFPVMIWATEDIKNAIIGDSGAGLPDPIENAHCYILVGYGDECYYLFDPAANKTYSYARGLVQRAYEALGSQAVTIVYTSTLPTYEEARHEAPESTPATPPQESKPQDNTSESTVADPIEVATGSHILKNDLMHLFGGQKLSLIAHYNSSKLCSGVLGIGWYHNYEKRLEVNGQTAVHYESPSEFSRYTACESCTEYCPDTKGKEGNLLTVTENGYCMDYNSERYEYYDLSGRLVKVVDKHGFETLLTYTETLITVTDTVTGKSIYLEKNADGKVIRVYDDAQRETVLTYQGDYLVNIRDVSNCILTYAYDDAGRVRSGTDRDDVRYFVDEYDSYGRVTKQTDASGKVLTAFEYGDNRDRICTNRNGNKSYRTFNSLWLLTDYTDENGNTKSYTYDEAFNIASVTDGLGNRTEIVYNRFKKPTQVKDRNGNITRYTYDEAGNLLKITYPAVNGVSAEETFSYNSRNQVVQHTDLRGTVTVYTYDANGMLSSKKVGAKNAVSYVYENGLLMSETDAKGNVTWYSYTENMKPYAVRLPDGNVILYAYDAEDRLIQETDRAGNVTKTVYDAGGQRGNADQSQGRRHNKDLRCQRQCSHRHRRGRQRHPQSVRCPVPPGPHGRSPFGHHRL